MIGFTPAELWALGAIVVVALLIVLGLQVEAKKVKARREARAAAEQRARFTAAIGRLAPAFAELAGAAQRATVPMQRFGDAFHEMHRTAARPTHRAARGERS